LSTTRPLPRTRAFRACPVLGISSPSAVAFIVFIACTLFPPRADSESCPPIATVEGDPAEAAALEQVLRADGIETAPMGACPGVRAHVARRGEGISVFIEDADGRSSVREVGTVEAAAALVESWARRDLSFAALEARLAEPGPTAPAGEIAAKGTTPAPQTVAPPVQPPVEERSRFRVGIAAEVSGGFDGSTWFGGRLGGCVRLGPACVGLTGRAAYDPGVAGDTKALDGQRLALDGLAIADFPVEWQRVSLVPGIGIGGGWIRSFGYAIHDEEGHNTGENTDESNKTDVVEDAGGLRIDAHLALLVLLKHRLALELALGVGISVPSHTSPYSGDGLYLAGEPRGFVCGGLGLIYGAP